MLQELMNYAMSRLEDGEQYMPLPPRFSVDSEDQERAWRHVLIDIKKVRSMADALRKSPAGKFAPKRVMNNIPDGNMLSIFYRNFGTREMIEKWFFEAGIKFTGLHHLLPSMIGRITRRELDEDTSLSEELQAIIEDEELLQLSENSEFLKRCLSKEFYESISEPLRDTLDLALNLLLAYPGTEHFASVFLPTCPWLAKNQPRIVAIVPDDDQGEGTSDKAFTRKDFKEFIQHYNKKMFDNAIDEDKEWGISDYHFHYLMLTRLSNDWSDDAADFFSYAFAREHKAILEGFDSIFELAKQYKVFDGVAAWADAEARLRFEYLETFIDVKSEDDIVTVGNFIAARKEKFSSQMDFIQEFHKALKHLERDVARLTEMTINQTGSLDEILQLTQAIGQNKAKSLEDVEHFAGIVNSYMDLFEEAHDNLLSIETDEELEGPTPGEIIELNESLEKMNNLLHVKESELLEVKSQLDKVTQGLETEKDRRIHQEAQLDSVKTALHEARQELLGRTTVESAGEPDRSSGVDGETLMGLLRGDLKRTPLMILDLLQAACPDRLVILESARKSARDAFNFDLPDRLLQLLDALINPYLDMIRSGKPDTEAKSLLPQSYAAKESDTVLKMPRLRSMREFRYQGEEILFTQHVGVGRNYGTQHAIRVYFKIIDEKIVIAYCGAHMENASTN